MIKGFTIGKWKIAITIARHARVIGVNSELEDGRHILMWDFDDVELDKVKEALWRVQSKYWLSEIFILRTKEPNNYIAYCFRTKEWPRAVEIVVSTEGVDWQFIRFGVFRGKFTLRVTPKGERTPYLVDRLEGLCSPDVSPQELKSWVRYETLSWR